MKEFFLASKGKRSVYKKVGAGLLALSLNLSLGSVGTMLLGSQVTYATAGYSITGSSSISGTTTVNLSGTASANPYTGLSSDQHVGVDWTGACKAKSAIEFGFDSVTFVGGNGGTFTNATWSTSHTFPSAGIYPVCVKVYHASFSGAEGSDAATFSADIVIPSISATITSPTPSGVTGTTGAINYTTIGVTAISCKIDGVAVLPPCGLNGPYSFIGLLGGLRTFTLDGTGPGGSVQASVSWTVDAVGPTVSITSGPTNGNKVKSTSATFGFSSAESGVTFECSLDNAAYATCTTPIAYTGLTQGAHTFDVRGIDTHGNTGASVSGSWTVDTIAPVIVLNGTTPNISVGGTYTELGATAVDAIDGSFAATPSGSVNTAVVGTYSITYNATDAAGNVATPVVRTVHVVDTTAPVIATPSDVTEEATSVSGAVVFYTSPATSDAVDGAGIATCSLPSGSSFPFGDTTVNCTATDAAGNEATPKSFVVHVVDITAPVVSVSAPTGPVKTVSATFSATDLFSIVSVECKVSGGDFAACDSPFAPSLTDGTYTITVRAVDIHSQTGVGVTGSFTIDLTLPAVSITAHPALLTNSTAAHFAFTGETGATLTCARDTTEFTPCTSPMDYTALGEGVHTFTVHATDEAGNVGADSFTWTVDTTAPTVAIVAPTINGTTGPSGSVTYTVGDGTVVCTLDGHTVSCSNTASLFTGLSDGDHTFTITSTDAAGNSTSQSVTWHVDATGPVVTIVSGPDQGSTVTTSSATLGFTSEEGATFECQLDDAAFTDCTSTKTYDALTDGLHTFTVRGTDTYGNVGASVTRSWTVNTTPATPTCETNQTLVDGHCVTNETPQPPAPTPPAPPSGGGGSGTYDYYGCTNTSATNFNSLANKDDGSCQLPGGNGGGVVTPAVAPQGEVLGAATTTGDLALPAGCSAYVNTFMKKGKKNNAEEVKLLQSFLNEEMSAGLPVTGFFGNSTHDWVKKFQVKHKAEILQPWIDAGFGGMSFGNKGTGYVYKTTKRVINMMKCSSITEPMPVLTPDTN